jgi:hypothetical protein
MTNSDPETPAEIALAYVATSSLVLRDPTAVAQAAFDYEGLELQQGLDLSKHLMFKLRDGDVFVSGMPGPIPWSDLRGPCATAWWWPEAEERMKVHRYHFIVGVMRGSWNALERRVLLTHVVAAATQQTDALGVYWAEGTLVHEPTRFIELAANASRDNPEIDLWVDTRIEQNEDGSYRAFTTGLSAFKLLEIEIQQTRTNPRELLQLLFDISSYALATKEAIKDGDTIGRSPTEKITMRQKRSMFGDRMVLALEL